MAGTNSAPVSLPHLPFNPARLRSYVLRLPLFTRIVLLVIAVCWLVELQSVWSVVEWGRLVPSDIGFGSSMDDSLGFPCCYYCRLACCCAMLVRQLTRWWCFPSVPA